MNLWVLLPILGGLFLLRFLKPNIVLWMIAWWAACLAILKYGVQPPMPSSIVGMYMAIVTVALLLYLSADSGRLVSAGGALKLFFTDRRYTVPLYSLVVLVPAAAGFNTWRDASREVEAPASGRTIHPAPPSSINFKGKEIDLARGVNPFRELESKDPEAFAAHLAEGRRVYYQNCVYCHGDNMEGDGIFAHGFDPLPANFQDPTTIAMLQESFLFWRIAKGGPGLPEESTPWASGMPAWEKFLTEEEIWDVILFLYKFTGQKPRAAEHHE
jgi:mono/diheme cytochrome c family protein